MNRRLPALDGLRGLAAVSVMLSHLPNNLVLLAFGPITYSIYGIAFAGSNAVQILFVLTGFLMAYLYPNVEKPHSFIQKRYTRIFPMYIFANIFFWTLYFQHKINSLITQLVFLLILAFVIRYIWKKIKSFDENGIAGITIFWCFIILQVEVFYFLVFIFPQIVSHFSEGTQFYSVLTLFSNVTLTTSFSKYMILVSNVFWSIPVEVFFYLLYPFFVIPIITVARKWGWTVGFFLILITTKIFFDLDNEFALYRAPLVGLNIAHSSGFIAGLTVGTVYQQQGVLWKKIEKLAQNTVIGIITFVLLIFTQWANVTLPYAGDKFANNYYFLFTSWVVAFTIIGAITPNSIIEKIFAKKFFVFLGIISYSLYLTHEQAIYWTKIILSFLHIPLWIYVLFTIIAATFISILLAWILYLIIDKLYFEYHQRLPKETVALVKKRKIFTHKPPSFLFLFISMSIYAALIFYIYLGHYQPSLIVDRHFVHANRTTSSSSFYPLSHGPVEIHFTSKSNNMGIVALHLEYEYPKIVLKNTPYDNIQFRLLNSEHNVIFTSNTPASYVAMSPEYQFGFPPISNSAGKQYIVELSLIPGKQGEKISLDTSQLNFTTLSILEKTKFWPIKLFINRVILIITTPSILIAILLIPIVFSEYILRFLSYFFVIIKSKSVKN